MDLSLILSVIAIIISIISLLWNIFIGCRDKGNIKATSEIFYIGISKIGENKTIKIPKLKIKAVNCGRRPVILERLDIKYANNKCMGSYIDREAGYLSENESYEFEIEPGNSNAFSPDGENAVDLWFVDTLGKRYIVKDAIGNLEKLWQTNNSSNDRAQ